MRERGKFPQDADSKQLVTSLATQHCGRNSAGLWSCSAAIPCGSHKMSLETSVWAKQASITARKGPSWFRLQWALSPGDVRSGEPLLGAIQSWDSRAR